MKVPIPWRDESLWALEGMQGWRGKSSVKGNNVNCIAQSEECSFHKTSVLKPEAQGQLHIWDPCYAQDWSAFCLTTAGPGGIEGLARPAGLTGRCSRFRQKAKPGFARHFLSSLWAYSYFKEMSSACLWFCSVNSSERCWGDTLSLQWVLGLSFCMFFFSAATLTRVERAHVTLLVPLVG